MCTCIMIILSDCHQILEENIDEIDNTGYQHLGLFPYLLAIYHLTSIFSSFRNVFLPIQRHFHGSDLINLPMQLIWTDPKFDYFSEDL